MTLIASRLRPATITATILVGLALVAAGCVPSSTAPATPVTIRIGGATSMRPVLQALTAEFSRRQPGVVFDLAGGDSGLAEQQVREGRLVLGASSLIPEEEEEAAVGAQARGATTPLVRTPIGIDGIAVVVHPSNPTPSLTLQQLHDLYNGQVIDWVELTGKSSEVVLVSREDGSGTRHAFDAAVMKDEAVALTAVVMPTSQDVVDFVGSHPSAIGYVSRAYVLPALAAAGQATIEAGGVGEAAPVRVLPVDGITPTAELVADQTYALVQPLYLLSKSAPAGLARGFVDFVLSPAGQAIVARYHVPVR